MKKRFICALASLALLLVTTGTLTAAWRPGLQGGFIQGRSQEVNNYPPFAEVYDGPHAATNYVDPSTASDTCPPIWAINRTWVYWGQMYFDGGPYRFAECQDDFAFLKIDGEVIIRNGSWGDTSVSKAISPSRGWHDFEVRLGNSSNGAGPVWGGTHSFGISRYPNPINDMKNFPYPFDPMGPVPVLFRYDDGGVFSNVLDISGSPACYGEATPAYGVTDGLTAGDKVACSVPAEVVVAPGVKAVAAGWVRYEVDEETHAETLAESGTGTSVEYLHGAKGGHLDWQWDLYHEVTVTASEGGTVAGAGGWVKEGDSVTLTAQPAEGFVFVKWTGDVPSAQIRSESATLTADRPLAVAPLFAPAATPVEKSWTGAGDGSRWDDGANWSPAGVPTFSDAVRIDSGKVLAETTLHAASIAIGAQGALWFGATNKVEGAISLFPLEERKYDFSVLGDVACAGQLVLGGKKMAGRCSYTIGGALALKQGAKAAVHPVAVDRPEEPLLRDDFTPVEIGGALSVAEGATLYVHSEELTGAHLRFRMASAAIDGVVDSNARGWGYFRAAEFIDGLGSIFADKYSGNDWWNTYAFGPGKNFGGAGHGGMGRNARAPFGQPYDNPYAPCLPGSPSGVVNAPPAGGGVIRMEALGSFDLNGTLTSKGLNNSVYSGSSGGSIWIAAKRFQRGPKAVLDVRGGGGFNGNGPGAGGRIAIAEGLKADDLASLEAGTVPDHVTAADYSANVLLTGGSYGKDPNTGDPLCAESGTAYYMTRDDAFVSITIATDVTGVPTLEPTPTWGVHVFPLTETITLTSPLFGTDPAVADRERYLCTGYTISNATGEVRSGPMNEFALPSDVPGPFWVLWRYARKEYKVTAEATAGGQIAGGGVVDGKGRYWVPIDTEIPALEAVADEGHEFLFWTGDVPAGKAKENPIHLTADRVRDVKAVFRLAEAPTTRTWKANAVGDWTNPANWEPAGNIPGFGDTVVLDSGVCFAPNHVECAALTVTGNGILRLCSQDPDNWRENGPVTNRRDLPRAPDGLEEVSLLVAGDLVLSGQGQLGIGTVYQPWQSLISIGGDLRLSDHAIFVATAGPVDGEGYTHAKGCGSFDVAGTFEIGPGAVFYPNSESFTGGSFAIDVQRLLVHEGGAIDASCRGYASNGGPKIWKTIAPGRGRSNNIGAGHGSKGVYAEGEWGQVYGQKNAPVEPGSPNGGYPNYYAGGGLIRVHADRIELDGALKTDAVTGDWLSAGPSGGAIWLTARVFRFGPTAVLNAAGGVTVGNGSNKPKPQGGGGRIAIEKGLSPAEIDHLAATGELPAGLEKHIVDATTFAQRHEGLTIDLRRGDLAEGCDGSFVYVDGVPPGTMLMLR